MNRRLPRRSSARAGAAAAAPSQWRQKVRATAAHGLCSGMGPLSAASRHSTTHSSILAAAGGAPEPPLVSVDPAAADIYADLFTEDGEGGTLLKTQVAEVTKCTGAALLCCAARPACLPCAPLL